MVVGVLLTAAPYSIVESLGLTPLSSLVLIALTGIGPALITAGAFALNDYHGFETDRINKRRDRPIVSGEIKRSHALLAAVALIIIGLLFSLLAGFYGFLIALVFALLSFAYDPFLKKLPLAGNIFIAFSMSAPFLYGALAGIFYFNPLGSIPELVLLLTAIAFLAGVGRELLKTLADVKGDKAIGATTLPMVIGARNTVYFAGLCFVAAILLSLVPLSSQFNLFYAIPIALCDLLLLYSATQAIKSPGNVTVLRKARNYTLAAMGAGVVGFLSLALV